jgi:predicted small lipoprotein YifL
MLSTFLCLETTMFQGEVLLSIVSVAQPILRDLPSDREMPVNNPTKSATKDLPKLAQLAVAHGCHFSGVSGYTALGLSSQSTQGRSQSRSKRRLGGGGLWLGSVLILVALLGNACGRKGALYLPSPENVQTEEPQTKDESKKTRKQTP